jgi:hypothetical protein
MGPHDLQVCQICATLSATLLLPLSLLQLGTYFDIEGRNSCLTAELRAGCVAFLTVSWHYMHVVPNGNARSLNGEMHSSSAATPQVTIHPKHFQRTLQHNQQMDLHLCLRTVLALVGLGQDNNC